ncbi:MAG: hypothetical protein A3J93_02790 [Candidatus Magasanikbacteria bacterium RIFOXYC2_FULL_42_28]|uniref:Uncharacterized protein n=1 Tax=Candidatus Magasanikbacteria bacterium RIFOXYC2_FULL_42_28 TaxID=1798704 RepID=A0A1F6NU41_9BACT|nr:MAG: hypothetical protein A3J93_02790 [Candidatus Magasanikbacteria bacterium RIFOXYC2_FULL_42_28]
MPLASFLPTLPWPLIDIVVNVVAGLGAFLIAYGVFLDAEKRQDAVFFVGAACLLVYALWIGNIIFSIAMSGLAAASFVEFIEIMIGYHKDHGVKNEPPKI